MDGYLTLEQTAFFPEVEDFLDWVDLQTTETLHTFAEFLPQLVQQLETCAVLMPQGLRQRLAPVLSRLRLLCH